MLKRVSLLFTLLALGFLAQCGSSFHPAAQTVGPQGPAGQAATVTVGQTTTGVPGSAAQVTNSGSSSAAVLNFVIPQGPQGMTGSTGPQGSAGPLLAPVVAVQTNAIIVPTGQNTPQLGPSVTTAIQESQLVAVTISAGIEITTNTAGDHAACSVVLILNGSINPPTGQDEIEVGSNAYATTLWQTYNSVQKTFFSVMQPGSYTWTMGYIGSNTSTTPASCSFDHNQISVQPYGAGSTMQSSGTF